MQQHTLEHTLGCTVARSCDAMQLLAKQGTLCGDGLLLEENEDNSFNTTLISYNKHNRLIARSWCSFISSLSQEMSARFLVPMMHSEEVVRPCGVFATVDPVACQQPRHLWLVTSSLTWIWAKRIVTEGDLEKGSHYYSLNCYMTLKNDPPTEAFRADGIMCYEYQHSAMNADETPPCILEVKCHVQQF